MHAEQSRRRFLVPAVLVLGLLLAGTGAVSAQDERYAPPPKSILTPDTVPTRIGTLDFFDGYPKADTVERVYNHLDFMRGVRAFLDTLQAASLVAMRQGFREVGAVDGTVGIFETLMDSKSLFLTANTESVYAMTWLDLKKGPVVVESPPNSLGIVDDFWFRYVADLGNAGPDRGKGGKFLFLPPGYTGEVPEGYYTYRSRTFGNLLIVRGFMVNGEPGPAVDSFKQRLRVYPLAQRGRAPAQKFVNLSGRAFNTVHANDFGFFAEVNQVVQEEPAGAGDPELLGVLASIGIVKGRPFAPDARMKRILTEAAAVGNATARAIVFRARDRAAYIFGDGAWITGFLGGDYQFAPKGYRALDARTLFHYYATGITPAMAVKMVGVGAQYAGATRDAAGEPFDGSKTYRLRLPPEVPVKDFWSIVIYDNQTRSMLQTDRRFPSLNSTRGVKRNADGSTDIFFGPTAPEGKQSNWIQTVPGKGWTVILRLYGPLQAWFDRTWRPGEIEWLEEVPAVEATGVSPKMTTEIPASVTTPDRVETRLGTLEFFDGFPTEETATKVYDYLDFMRGVESFLSAIPAASIYAMREGAREIGSGRNGVVSITESLMDSHSLYLTANTESVYIGAFLDLKGGPIVVESPPNTLGMLNDFFFRYVADLGNAGPDKGQGGKYLFLPPDWEGDVPEGFFTFRSRTYANLLFWRGFLVDGDPGPAVKAAKDVIRIYPLAWPRDREKIRFIDSSGKYHNTIHANDIDFYREVDEVVQEEPTGAFNPEILGLLAGVGVEKGRRFEPDARMRGILEDAAAVGNATARAISFRSRDPRAFFYENAAWFTPFIGGSHEFLRQGGARDLDARTMFHYPYTAVTPAMTIKMVGVGSQYAVACVDANGAYLDGSRTYSVTLPKGIPAKDFWSFVLYDPQTRSLLQTPRTVYPSLGSQRSGVEPNDDGSFTVYFGPQAPAGKEKNWIQTVSGKGFFVILRLYGPLESWFDKSWRPGDIEPAR